MRYSTTLDQPISLVLEKLATLPGERGDNWGKSYALKYSSGRIYASLDGNQFQISETAGMGGTPTCFGTVTGNEEQTVVRLFFRLGPLPNLTFLLAFLGAVVAAVIAYFLGKPFYATAFSVVSALSLFYLWEAWGSVKFILRTLSDLFPGSVWR